MNSHGPFARVAPSSTLRSSGLHKLTTLVRTGPAAKRRQGRLTRLLVATASLASLPGAAIAVDGCKALLCLAAPDWRQIPQCVPTIEELLRDLRRGRPFPRCDMAGVGNDAQLQPAYAPGGCPPQYTVEGYGENGPIFGCQYASVIQVRVNGEPWTNLWWNFDGDSVTEYLPPAKAQLGTWNTRFDQEYEAWRAAQPPEAPPPPESMGG